MGPQSPAGPQGNYDFIMNPQKPSRGGFNFNGSSLGMRLAVAGGGFVVLLIVISVAMNLLKGSDNSKPALLAVAQQQQALIHLTTGLLDQQGISQSNSNVGVTVNLTVGSEQKALFTYLTNNKYKISLQQVNLGVKLPLDAQLQNAQSAGTYNTTFQTIIGQQLDTYSTLLKRAYPTVKGPKGRAMLKQDFDEVTLLKQQLQSTSGTSSSN